MRTTEGDRALRTPSYVPAKRSLVSFTPGQVSPKRSDLGGGGLANSCIYIKESVRRHSSGLYAFQPFTLLGGS